MVAKYLVYVRAQAAFLLGQNVAGGAWMMNPTRDSGRGSLESSVPSRCLDLGQSFECLTVGCRSVFYNCLMLNVKCACERLRFEIQVLKVRRIHR
jgi:hypothetical protein